MKIPVTPGLKVSNIFFITYSTSDRAFSIEVDHPLGCPVLIASLIPGCRARGRDVRDRWAAVLWPVSAPPVPSVDRDRWAEMGILGLTILHWERSFDLISLWGRSFLLISFWETSSDLLSCRVRSLGLTFYREWTLGFISLRERALDVTSYRERALGLRTLRGPELERGTTTFLGSSSL